jgi:hypothetical protein
MEAMAARLAEIERRQRDQADLIAGLGDLGGQVSQICCRPSRRSPPGPSSNRETRIWKPGDSRLFRSRRRSQPGVNEVWVAGTP